jgi:D-alanyl-D-alanine carboxypeptidase
MRLSFFSMTTRGAWVAFIAVLLWGTSVPSAHADEGALVSPDAELDRALRNLVAMDGGPPGVIAIVQRDGRRAIHTAGVMDVGTGRPIGSRDHMRIASVAKAFSGAVALALVDRGVLSLDDTVGEWLPELPDDWSAVTLRELLSHTSGLPDYTDAPEFQADVSADPTAYIPPEDLLPYVYGEDLEFTPGSRYQYSNSDNIAVGLIVEAATGTSYDDALERYVYARARITETSLPIIPEQPSPFLHGYVRGRREPSGPERDRQPIGAWASGGIESTPRDLNAFIRGLLGRSYFGRLTQQEQLVFIEGGMSDPPGPGENSAGLAIFRYETSCGTVYGHTGNFPGYTQFAAASRDGARSATVSASLQIRPDLDAEVFAQLRHTFELAACAALGRVGSDDTRVPRLLRDRG